MRTCNNPREKLRVITSDFPASLQILRGNKEEKNKVHVFSPNLLTGRIKGLASYYYDRIVSDTYALHILNAIN